MLTSVKNLKKEKRKKIGKFQILVMILLAVVFAGTCWAETYEGWLGKCKSYKDVDKWFKKYLGCDRARDNVMKMNENKFSKGKTKELMKIWSPEETFKNVKKELEDPMFGTVGVAGKGGMDMDAAVFAKHSLNRLNPKYKAEIISIETQKNWFEYACGFYVEGSLYVMNYWTSSLVDIDCGTHGPFKDLNEFAMKVVLAKYYVPTKKVEIQFGWRGVRSNEKW